MNAAIYIISILLAEAISFTIVSHSSTNAPGSSKMLSATFLSVILSIVFITSDIIIIHF